MKNKVLWLLLCLATCTTIASHAAGQGSPTNPHKGFSVGSSDWMGEQLGGFARFEIGAGVGASLVILLSMPKLIRKLRTIEPFVRVMFPGKTTDQLEQLLSKNNSSLSSEQVTLLCNYLSLKSKLAEKKFWLSCGVANIVTGGAVLALTKYLA